MNWEKLDKRNMISINAGDLAILVKAAKDELHTLENTSRDEDQMYRLHKAIVFAEAHAEQQIPSTVGDCSYITLKMQYLGTLNFLGSVSHKLTEENRETVEQIMGDAARTLAEFKWTRTMDNFHISFGGRL